MKTLIAAGGILSAVLAGAATVSNVTVTQDPATRVVTVGYDLDENAIVTVELAADGAPIPVERCVTLSGDVNRRVAAGDAHRILWCSDKDWPGHSAAKLTATVTAWSLDVPPDYMVVDLGVKRTANCDPVSFYATSNAVPGGVTARIYKTEKLIMRRIPAAGVTWRMGAEKGKWLSEADNPWHYVSFTDDYYVGVYPVTMGQYRKLCGRYPEGAMKSFDMTLIEDKDCHPAGGISYGYYSKDGSYAYLRDDTWPTSSVRDGTHLYQYGFLGRLTSQSGHVFDLPTDAEWEYACRATTDNTLNTPGNQGHVSTSAEDGVCAYTDVVSWYNMNSGNVSHPVGLKVPNTWGLYDMHGNVWEWCLDWFGSLTGSTTPVENPTGASSGEKRIRRGGGYSSAAKYHRSSGRSNATPESNYANHGFRAWCPAKIGF